MGGGRPNLGDRWVVNGEIFATTYNNQGWGDCLRRHDNAQSITIAQLPKLIPLNLQKGQDNSILGYVHQSLSQLSQTCVKQMPFNVRMRDNMVQVKPSVIADYKKEMSGSKDGKISKRQREFDNFITNIEVKDDKLVMKSYVLYKDGSKVLTYQIALPANEQGMSMFQEKLPIYAGLMGYIPNGVQNSFRMEGTPSKYEYDAIEAYTISSSGINRKLRLLDYESEKNQHGYERVGAESQRLYRAIDGADKYFDKCVSTQPLTVFRGMPACDAVEFSGANSLEDIKGKVITNTAYTSSTLNLHSTMMFAKVEKDPHNGVILAINIPIGTHADYIHNIAGWKEQFEVLWDRKYDIVVDNKLLSFKGGNNFMYHIFSAHIQEHAPFSHIPKFISTEYHSNVSGIELYDQNGRISFDYKMIRGDLKIAFDILKKRGLSGLQYQERLQIDPGQRDFIVVRTGEGDDKVMVDLAFSYNTNTEMIDVCRFKSQVDDTGKSVRNYWQDKNRNDNAIDQNFSWEQYNANDAKFQENGGVFSVEIKSSITLRSPSNTEHNIAKGIAYTILEYVKYNKDVTLLPMQDVARYFDTVFKSIVINEGYELRDSMPVNRVGKESDENDGYVPMKYLIDGDNDDKLTLMMKMDRSSEGKLQLAFKGQSANKRVNEQKTMRWNIFNQTVMEKACTSILYLFASKLNLNHTRKADKLMNYVAMNKGYSLTNSRDGKASERSIHEKGNHKNYRLWSADRKYWVAVELDAVGTDYNISISDVNGAGNSLTIPRNIRIVDMYQIFKEAIDGLGA